MGKRKYLISFIVILCPFTSLPSPWIPTVGSYKYYFTTLNTNLYTKSIDSKNKELLSSLNNRIIKLLEEKAEIESKSNAKDLKRLKCLNKKIIRLQNKFISLQNFLGFRLFFSSIEFGATPESSFGVKLLEKKHDFSYFTPCDAFKRERTVSLFYKYLIFENDTDILTISPEFIIKKINLRKRDLYFAVALYQGKSKNLKGKKLFIDTGLTIIKSINKTKGTDILLSFSTAQGLDLFDNITVNNYTKFNYLPGNTGIYKRSLYEQISVSSSVFPNKIKECYVSVGYFWDKSLVKSKFKNSGYVFSFWKTV